MRYILLLAFLIPTFLFSQVKYSNEAKKLYNKGVKEFESGNTDAALGLFFQCVSVESRYAEAYLNISLIQYGKKEMGQSLTYAKKAYFHNKFEAPIYTQLGKSYYHNGEYDSSAFFLNKGIEMGASDEYALIYAGKSFYHEEEYAKAEDFLTKAIAMNGKNPVSYNSRGKVHYATAEYEKAEADFLKSLEINPKSGGVYANLANTYLHLEKPEEATSYVTKGIELGTDDQKVQLLLVLGNYYHQSGDFEKASEQYESAFNLDKKNTAVLTNQAALYLDQDKFESALEKCNKALDIDPEMMEAYFNRGIANEMLRNVVEACSDWEQAFILGSEKAEEYLNSATCNE